MTPEQLDEVVAATGHARYRWLTSDANPDPASREGYRRLVASKAEALAAPPAGPALARVLAVQACPHRSPDPACGCPSMARCARRGKDVGVEECAACLEGGGDGRDITP